jgi:hypothetical protein
MPTYEVTVTYQIETSPEAKDREPKEVAAVVKRQLPALTLGVSPFWAINPKKFRVKVRRT